ncbi:siderophore-interacting protein [Citreimonas salinaria]|uniref:siderophore-interacting protein n=1 Tax=Citreimonas salinaria TaxID=321339 RepID=UPI001FDF1EC2|nr:siderophore-interacting protein [Citreimonas salinaria]
MPDNARLMTVQAIEQLDCGFCRLTLEADVSRFSDTAIHFRLGLPPAGGSKLVWPRLGPNGATIWPKGQDALHLPVYTARRVDPQSGRLEFDLYQRDGDRTTHWAAHTSNGARVLVAGHGGGGCRVGGPLLGFAANGRIGEAASRGVSRRSRSRSDRERDLPRFNARPAFSRR